MLTAMLTGARKIISYKFSQPALETLTNPLTQKRLAYLILLLCAASFKAWLITSDSVPFNSDEAIVALMARHILQGERPVFYYGQAYMGSLDAWLVASGFWLFGEQIWVIRLVQLVLYLGTMLTTARIGELFFTSWRTGVVAMLLIAIPTVNVTLYTTASLGGYGEALLLGNLILLTAFRIAIISQSSSKFLYGWWWLAGLLIGFGMWAFSLTLVYSLPAVIYLTWNVSRNIARIQGRKACSALALPLICIGVGFLFGAIPWWTYAFIHGISKPISETIGAAIAGVEGLPWQAGIWRHLTNLVLLGSSVILGLRPPWEVRWLALPLLPLVLSFWLAAGVHTAGSLRRSSWPAAQRILLLGVAATTLAAYVISPFGADPSGRYFLPLTVPMALFAADMLVGLRDKIGNRVWLLPGIVILFHLGGTLQCITRNPPGLTTQFYPITQIDHRADQALIEFLQHNGETRGYTNYWVAYPLAFLSREGLIFVPRLPYHPDFRYTPRDDRYPPYDELVDRADRVAYITTNHSALDRLLQARFLQAGISWQEATIGDYHIFYNLSRVIRLEDN